MPLSPQYRRFQNRYYLEYSERDAAISHLWHAQRLAEARLRSEKGITDAPDVDFRHPEMTDVEQSRAMAVLTRLHRRVLDEEGRVVRGNFALRDNLFLVSDDAFRARRHMNNIPTESERSKWYRRDQQLLARRRDRLGRERTVRSANATLLGHLVSAPPSVPVARRLGAWYATHRRRVARLRRFRRAEPFAGSTVLRKECGVRRAGPSAASPPAQEPLVWRKRRVLTMLETLDEGPLLPSLRAASGGYVAGNLPHTGGGRPPWKSISALDTTLMNHASDVMLVRGGEAPVVRRDEENGVTRLWRDGVERLEKARERQRRRLKPDEPDVAQAQVSHPNIPGLPTPTPKVRRTSSVQLDKDRWAKGRRSTLLSLLARPPGLSLDGGSKKVSPTSPNMSGMIGSVERAKMVPKEPTRPTAPPTGEGPERENQEKKRIGESSLQWSSPKLESAGRHRRMVSISIEDIPIASPTSLPPHARFTAERVPRLKETKTPHHEPSTREKVAVEDAGMAAWGDTNTTAADGSTTLPPSRRLTLTDWTESLRNSTAPFAPF